MAPDLYILVVPGGKVALAKTCNLTNGITFGVETMPELSSKKAS
jgi:hypothetical protein